MTDRPLRAVGWPGVMAAPGGADETDSDESLFGRARGGDQNAFSALVERHQDRLFQFLRFTLRVPDAEAEDLAQETFIQTYRAMASFRGQSSFRTWMYGIARNLCRGRGSAAVWDRAGRADEQTLLSLVDSRPGPLAALEERQSHQALHAAIGELAPVHRAAVFLRDIEGLSYEEIAHALGVPVGTVRSRLHNARAQLASRLNGSTARS